MQRDLDCTVPSRCTDTGKLESSPGPELGSPGMNSAFPHPVICSWPQNYCLKWEQNQISALTVVPQAGVFAAGPNQDVFTVSGSEVLQVGFSCKHLLFYILKESWRLLGGSVVSGFKACVIAEPHVPRAVDRHKETC